MRTFISPKPGSSASRARRSVAALGLAPEPRSVSRVALVQERAERPHAFGHGAGEAMQRRALAKRRRQRVGIHGGDAGDVEVPEALAQLERPGERLLHGDLLIEDEADEERDGIRGDEAIRLVVGGEREALGSGCGTSHVGRVPT